MRKHILLVRSGYPSKQFVLEKLQELGYYVIVLDSSRTCPEQYVNHWIFADLSEPEACVTAVKDYLSEKGTYIDGVLTFWEEAVMVTAKLAETFGWVGIPLQNVENIKNKYTFRRICAEQRLPTTKCGLLQSEKDFETIEKELTFPLVVKPVYGAASAFVMKVDSLNELQKAYAKINKYIKDFWLAPEWKTIDVFVEEYIDGQEVDIDILIQNQKIIFYSITDNFQTHEPFFVETGQAIPSGLSQEKQDELISMAENVLLKNGVENGCIHFEAKSSSNGPIPIEVNLRMGGDEVYSFVKHAWHVDLVEYSAKIAVGEKISIIKPKKPFSYLEGKYFLPQEEGTLTKIVIDDTVKNSPYILDLHLTKKEGETILMPPRDFDYFGWLTIAADSPEEAHAKLVSSFDKVIFVTKK